MTTLSPSAPAASSAVTVVPQPRPLFTSTVRRDGEDADDETVTLITRVWTAADQSACALCPASACSALRGPVVVGRDGRRARGYVCHVAVTGTVSRRSAPLFVLPS